MIRKISIVAVMVLLPAALFAQTAQTTPTVKKGPAPYTSSSDAAQMFTTYCAPCHGRTGKGDGPAAAALTPKPADLTQLTKKHGGAFPARDFEDKLNGMGMSPAHGSTDMPVWGPILRQLGNEQLRVSNLKNYVETLQAK